MKSKAHSLKGASGYIGAVNLHHACYCIQEQYMAGNYENMLDYYPMLIEASVEFRAAYRKLLAENEGRPYNPNRNPTTIPLAQGYRL